MVNKTMRKYILAYILTYWTIGILAGLLFRLGGVTAELRVWCFIGGNLFGITSTWFLMKLYSSMNVNIATVISSAGTFILFQFILWKYFHSPLSWSQWLGLTMMTVGIVMAVLKSDTPEHDDLPLNLQEVHHD
jgi:drug/metabolite transporter (DMT)-like permease